MVIIQQCIARQWTKFSIHSVGQVMTHLKHTHVYFLSLTDPDYDSSFEKIIYGAVLKRSDLLFRISCIK